MKHHNNRTLITYESDNNNRTLITYKSGTGEEKNNVKIIFKFQK